MYFTVRISIILILFIRLTSYVYQIGKALEIEKDIFDMHQKMKEKAQA
jgi:uncharacterized UPF0160 family protein